eukprot:scaffold16319_cov77-Phaeocystis_antarctica.AAC.3
MAWVLPGIRLVFDGPKTVMSKLTSGCAVISCGPADLVPAKNAHILAHSQPTNSRETAHVYDRGALRQSPALALSVTAEQMVSEADANGSGNINIEEFTDVCLRILRLPMTTEEIEVVFQFVDKD